MDYKAEIIKLLEPVKADFILKVIYESIVNILKP